MSARAYRLGKREAGVEDTRGKIIQAADALFSETGFLGASLDDVAKRAGVARATVYYQFESKYGLLDQVVTAKLQSRRAEGLRRAREHRDAVTGLYSYFHEVCKFWQGDYALFRNVLGLAAVDPLAAKLFDGYDDRRRELLTWLVKRLSDQGKLREGVAHQYGTNVLWLLSSFRSFDQLHTRAQLTVKEVGDLLADLAGVILTDEARRTLAVSAAR